MSGARLTTWFGPDRLMWEFAHVEHGSLIHHIFPDEATAEKHAGLLAKNFPAQSVGVVRRQWGRESFNAMIWHECVTPDGIHYRVGVANPDA